jgi:hypothetical protein
MLATVPGNKVMQSQRSPSKKTVSTKESRRDDEMSSDDEEDNVCITLWYYLLLMLIRLDLDTPHSSERQCPVQRKHF